MMSQSAKSKKRRASDAPKLKRQKAIRPPSPGLKMRPTSGPKKTDGSGDAQSKRRESRATKSPGFTKKKEPAKGLSPKKDRWYKGRNLYPAKGKDGNLTYLPQKSDATPKELREGQFVKDVDTGKEAAEGTPPRADRMRGRNLYATVGEDGKTTYLPQKSEATPKELLEGTFVKDLDLGKEVSDGPTKKDKWYKGRNLYPVRDADGKVTYLPQRSEATPSEIQKGDFVKDVDSGRDVLDGTPPKPDRWYRGRNLYPTLDDKGQTIYLPQKSEATPAERLSGRYVKDEDNGKEAIDGYTPKEDKARGRNLYAALGDEGEVIYLPQESEATPKELLEGQFVEDQDPGYEVIEVLPENTKPKADDRTKVEDQGRFLYPVKVASEQEGEPFNIVYYPRESEATEVEKQKGQFIRDEEVTDESESKRRSERATRIKGRNRSNAISEATGFNKRRN
ncbi:MAG: hypothetical protein AAGA66_01325 [Bacteroidota bacterium]